MADTRYTIPLFGLGIALHYYLIISPLTLFVYSFIFFIFGLFTYITRHTRYRPLFIGCLVLSVGVAYADWRSKEGCNVPPLSIGQHCFKGHIVNLPQEKKQITRFHFVSENSPYHLLIHANKNKFPTAFLPGQYWHMCIHIQPSHSYRNPGSNDFLQWQNREGIHAQAFLNSATLLSQHTHIALIDQLRAYLKGKILKILGDTEESAVILALTIGEQSHISEAQWTRFRQTGIIHLVSISGLHVTMLAGLIILISRRLFYLCPFILYRWPVYKPALIMGCIAAFIYALIAGFSIPTQRTVFMLLASTLAILSSKNLSAIQIWLSALLAVLLLDPSALQSLGFWLSFLCVGALIISSTHRLKNLTSLRLWIKSQWVATLASFPILAVVFQSVPLLSPIANALAIPLVSLIITPLALLGLFDPTGYTLHIAAYLLYYQDLLLAYLLKLPHTYTFQAPPVWSIFPASFSVLLLLLPQGFPLRLWAFIGFLPLFLLSRTAIELGQWQAIAIDVGQGLSVLIQTKHHQLIFDTGTKKAAKPALMKVVDFYGIKKLDVLVLSHDDNDHTGGAPLLMQKIPVQTLLSSLSDTHPLHQLAPHSLSCLVPRTWEWDGVSFTLMPTAVQDKAQEDNEKSCVLKINNAQLSVLITGDIGFREEKALIEEYQDALDVDIVFAPHHGSKYASSTAFIAATTPQWVIFSAGLKNPYHHPHKDTVARYTEQGSAVFRTDTQGAIFIDSAKTVPISGFIQNKS